MQLRSALLAATVLATPFAASAQPVTGLYVGLGAGVNITQQQSINRNGFRNTVFGSTASTIGPVGSGNLHGSTGFAGLLNVGWGFGNGLRAEIEGNYRNNHSSGFSASNSNLAFVGANTGGGTTEQKFGGLVNVLYDFNGVTPWFVPYIGVGVGYIGINEKWNVNNPLLIQTSLTSSSAAGVTASGKSTQGSFAYQAILGASFPLTQIPGLAATLEYHFLGTTGNRNYTGTAVAVSTTGAVRTAPAGISLGANYNHAILVGLRYNFGVAPPPPPPPAQPPIAQPARSYLVFFDWDKATLTDRARQIIKEAADNSTRVQYTKIEVNGYTDTSGTPKYNLGLSVRRARAVEAELVKNGVPANAITIQGFGDTHLLVPTGPGVREPQNRRVEIIIR
jgi:outer membrane protein OmpA-like peptidoglycan-associated protein